MNFHPPRRERAQATRMLIMANVVIFLLGELSSPALRNLIEWSFGLNLPALLQGRVWTLLTYQFLHGSFLHIFMNMLGLWFVGRELEMVLGTRRFVGLYLVGGVVAGLAQVLIQPSTHLLVGASGSVCAVLLALVTLFPNAPVTALIFFVLPIRMRARTLGIGIVVVSIVFWLSGLDPGVGHLAHLGGLATGFVYALVYRRQAGLSGGTANPFAGGFRSFGGSRVQEAKFEVVRDAPSLDEILAKVMREGIDSLTREERAILEGARRPRPWR